MKVSIGDSRIDGVVVYLAPFGSINARHCPAVIAPGFDFLADARGLVRRENDEPQSGVDQLAHHLVIARSLWQPHRFRIALEAFAEICQAPTNLSAAVALVAQGKDGMPIRLSDRVAMTATHTRAGLIGVDDPRVGVGMIPLEPAQ